MKSKGYTTRSGQFTAFALVSGALFATLAMGSPARAGDDGQGSVLGSLMSMVGLGNNSDPAPPQIDYSQRSPLVLPSSAALPPPSPSPERNPAWPKDPDVEAARRAAALARAPAQTAGEDQQMSWRQMQNDRIANGGQAVTGGKTGLSDPKCELDEHQCDPRLIWDPLKIKSGDPGTTPNAPALVAGREPPRQYLTEPPPGYRTATQVVKRTWQAPHNPDADDNSSTYWLRQAGQKVAGDDSN